MSIDYLSGVDGNFSVNEAIGVRVIVTKFFFLSSTIPVYSALARLAEIWSPIPGTVACQLVKSEWRQLMQQWAVAVLFVFLRGLKI
jgi:hypothetical protein